MMMIITPPYSGKDVVGSKVSTPSRPPCIYHNSHKKQSQRQVSWGACDEIILVDKEDVTTGSTTGRDDPNKNRSTSSIPTDAYSRDRSMSIPNHLPIPTVATPSRLTAELPFPRSVTTIHSGYGSHINTGSHQDIVTTTPLCDCTTATTYLELEQQFRHSPRLPLPPQLSRHGINDHYANASTVVPIQPNVHFRKIPVHNFDDDDDDSSCFTNIDDNGEDDNMDNTMFPPKLDLLLQHHRRAPNHPKYHHDCEKNDFDNNYNDDDDDEEEEEDQDDDVLQTPDHTIYYYYNSNRNAPPPQQPQPSLSSLSFQSSSPYF
jgi:hypothetical protein